MLKKIISGGQTGADQAALDAAMKFNIPHGGWIPKGRKTEAGALSLKYQMTEMNTSSYPARTRKNIMESDGTLIISGSDLTKGSLLTKRIAQEVGKPLCHIDYLVMDDFETTMVVDSFILDNEIEVLNVAGPRLSNDPEIYENTRWIVESMIYIVELESGKGLEKIEFLPSSEKNKKNVETTEDIVLFLDDTLTLKTKTAIARLPDDTIACLYHELSDYLLNSSLCKPGVVITSADFVMGIVKALKEHLEKIYGLKVVK